MKSEWGQVSWIEREREEESRSWEDKRIGWGIKPWTVSGERGARHKGAMSWWKTWVGGGRHLAQNCTHVTTACTSLLLTQQHRFLTRLYLHPKEVEEGGAREGGSKRVM